MQIVFFMALVGLASFCQNLTGFAFGLIFVGVAGAAGLMSIADAANVACLLSIINGVSYMRAYRFEADWAMLRPMLISSVLGVIGGVVLLYWLSGNALNVLRMLLGAVIVACAYLLFARREGAGKAGGPVALWGAGIASGLLGGLFATPGPPMVYYLYRQPIEAAVVRQCLFVLLIINAVLRLGLVAVDGQLGSTAVLATALAFPVVAGVTWLQARRPPQWPRRVVEALVCVLLLLSGLSLLVSGLRA